MFPWNEAAVRGLCVVLRHKDPRMRTEAASACCPLGMLAKASAETLRMVAEDSDPAGGSGAGAGNQGGHFRKNFLPMLLSSRGGRNKITNSPAAWFSGDWATPRKFATGFSGHWRYSSQKHDSLPVWNSGKCAGQEHSAKTGEP